MIILFHDYEQEETSEELQKDPFNLSNDEYYSAKHSKYSCYQLGSYDFNYAG
mgnify:CR=1 FL=1